MAIVPEAALSLRAGQGSLGHYTWNSGLAKHYFCSVCGIYVFHRKRAMQGHFSVNAYCLVGLDVAAMPVRATEGVGMSIVDANARAEWPGPRDCRCNGDPTAGTAELREGGLNPAAQRSPLLADSGRSCLPRSGERPS